MKKASHRKINPDGLQTNKKMLYPSHIQEKANDNIKEINALQWKQHGSITTSVNKDVEAQELVHSL